MYLLDTNVLSEMRKSRANATVMQWFTKQDPEALFLSVITLGEIERGAFQQRTVNPVFSNILSTWVIYIQRVYSDRMLDITPAIAKRWGELSAELGNSSVDLMIAATALTHNLTIVTRNVKHFESTKVKLLNPFEPATED